MLVYTALGDSITAGHNASPGHAYPSLLVSHLQSRGGAVCGGVVAQEGWTSGALRAVVLSEPPVPLGRSSAVTIWVGGNDLANAGLRVLRGAPVSTVAGVVTAYAGNLAAVVGAVRACGAERIIVCTQYNPFPNSPVAVEGVGKLNEVTAAVAARERVLLAPVHAWFGGRQAQLISGYGTGRVEDVLRSPVLPVHPNDAGHRVIAQGLEGMIR